MPFRGRDPSKTGNIRFPWRTDSPCRCESGLLAGECCLGPDGRLYKRVEYPNPPLPRTGYANTSCFLNGTRNCSTKITGEHFVSAAVLRILDESFIKVRGMPWAPTGVVKDIPISGLRSNILCKRHNEAMAPLDAAAGRFFNAVRTIFDDIAEVKSLSRKAKWFLFSGEELELWLVKTAFGLYHSGAMADGGSPLRKTTVINPSILGALDGFVIPPPCGLYVQATSGVHVGQRNAIDVSPLFTDNRSRVVGLNLAFMGLTFLLLFDPQAQYLAFDKSYSYRPMCIRFQNKQRKHTAVLTWQNRQVGPQRLVLYTRN